MEIEYHKEYSTRLCREMEYKLYGREGKAMFVFPSQDKRFWEYEDEGMVACLQPWIDAGKLRLICCDAIDRETWSNTTGDGRWRSEQQERWFHYITDELFPRVRRGWEQMIVTGCSLGAYHAANLFFRRPDLCDTLISLSGIFRANYFFGDYCDEKLYFNSPQDYLANMPADNPLWEEYRRRRLIFCVGQGAWEDDMVPSNRAMEQILHSHGVNAWFDYWGHDVAHDWPWWRKQIVYFVDKLGL